jgi:tRNA pseudouridine55 synthase
VVSECGHTDFGEDALREAFGRFKGEIEQRPPAYSALKHEGVPLYKLARKGKAIQKPPRGVSISRLDILDIRLPEIRFEVVCSGGTYIRTLASDIGGALGCGAHLTSLRRLESSGFHIREAVSLSELEDKVFRKERIGIIGMADALRGMPLHLAEENLGKKIAHGVPLTDRDLAWERDRPEAFLKVTDAENRLLAVLTRDEETGGYRYCCVFHEQSVSRA